MNANLDYCYKFSSPKDPELQFEIVPLTPDILEETLILLTNAYHKRDPLVVHLEIPYEVINISQRLYAQRSMEENLAFVVKDVKKSKVVGAGIQIDVYSMEQNPIDYTKVFPPDCKLFQLQALENAMTWANDYPATKLLEVIHGCFVAVDEKYSGNKIQFHCNKFVLEEHPLIMKARVFFTEVYNGISAKVCEQSGWKIVETLDLRTLVNDKGDKIFEKIDETVKKIGLPDFEKLYVLAHLGNV